MRTSILAILFFFVSSIVSALPVHTNPTNSEDLTLVKRLKSGRLEPQRKPSPKSKDPYFKYLEEKWKNDRAGPVNGVPLPGSEEMYKLKTPVQNCVAAIQRVVTKDAGSTRKVSTAINNLRKQGRKGGLLTSAEDGGYNGKTFYVITEVPVSVSSGA